MESTYTCTRKLIFYFKVGALASEPRIVRWITIFVQIIPIIVYIYGLDDKYADNLF